jgi:hypothetical protein
MNGQLQRSAKGDPASGGPFGVLNLVADRTPKSISQR